MNKELRASIDIGSNSVLLLIADVSNSKFTEISKRSEITQLGKELDKNKVFHQDSMNATYSAIKSYVEDCSKFGITPESIIATATEASRIAQNAFDFFNKILLRLVFHFTRKSGCTIILSTRKSRLRT